MKGKKIFFLFVTTVECKVEFRKIIAKKSRGPYDVPAWTLLDGRNKTTDQVPETEQYRKFLQNSIETNKWVSTVQQLTMQHSIWVPNVSFNN